MAGGRNLLKVGQVFQFVGQRFFFKLPTDHFFPISLGHETWWPTFFNCDNIWNDNLQNRERLTYQLSSGGVGRGKDEGPFFFHHPEKKANQIWSFDPQQKYDGNWSRWLNTVAFNNSLVLVWHAKTKISNVWLWYFDQHELSIRVAEIVVSWHRVWEEVVTERFHRNG